MILERKMNEHDEQVVNNQLRLMELGSSKIVKVIIVFQFISALIFFIIGFMLSKEIFPLDLTSYNLGIISANIFISSLLFSVTISLIPTVILSLIYQFSKDMNVKIVLKILRFIKVLLFIPLVLIILLSIFIALQFIVLMLFEAITYFFALLIYALIAFLMLNFIHRIVDFIEDIEANLEGRWTERANPDSLFGYIKAIIVLDALTFFSWFFLLGVDYGTGLNELMSASLLLRFVSTIFAFVNVFLVYAFLHKMYIFYTAYGFEDSHIKEDEFKMKFNKLVEENKWKI